MFGKFILEEETCGCGRRAGLAFLCLGLAVSLCVRAAEADSFGNMLLDDFCRGQTTAVKDRSAETREAWMCSCLLVSACGPGGASFGISGYLLVSFVGGP